jgi:eukaryotic translation initiation factor 2C
LTYRPRDGTIPPPPTKITDLENNIITGAKGALDFQSLSLKQTSPVRPGFGTKGVKVTLWANYFEITPPSNMVLYRYDIAVTPGANGKKMQQIVRLFLEIPELVPYREDLVTDFKSTLISRKRIDKDEIIKEISYRDEGEDEPRQNALKYKVRLVYTNTLSLSELISYLTSTSAGARFDDAAPLIQALNIFLNYYTKSTGSLATVGAHKSFSLAPDAAKMSLGAGLTAIRGFFSSVRVATGRILVNTNVSHGAFFDTGPLDQLMRSYSAANRNDLRKLEKFIHKLKIRPTHLPERKNRSGQVVHKIKTILGLARIDDGHRLEHRPKVKKFGAGARDVEFWLENAKSTPTEKAAGGKKKGAKSAAPAPSSSGGRYISVYDYFFKSISTDLCLLYVH